MFTFFFVVYVLNKIRNLFKVKLYTTRSETKRERKKREREKREKEKKKEKKKRERERERKRDFKNLLTLILTGGHK